MLHHEGVLSIGLVAGIVFVIFYIINILKTPVVAVGSNNIQADENIWKVLVVLFGIYFLNPQAFIEVVVILGAISAQYQGQGAERFAFGAGCIASSWGWFVGLGLSGRYFATYLASVRARLWLNRLTVIILLIVVLGMVSSLLNINGFVFSETHLCDFLYLFVKKLMTS